MTQRCNQIWLKAAISIPSCAGAPQGVSRLGTRAWDGPSKGFGGGQNGRVSGEAIVKQQAPAASEVVKASVAVGEGEAVQGLPG
jgi:hypothetical protein